MNTKKQQNFFCGSTTKRKTWHKPVIITISKEELKNYINAAARSGACLGWGR